MIENQTVNLFEGQDIYVPQMMRTDIKEKDGSYLLEIELPGFAKEEVQAELVDGMLTIIANRPDMIESEEKKLNYIRKERIVNSCKRSFFVGSRVTQDDITAAFKDGILNIIITNNEMSVDREEIKLIQIH